MATHSQIDMPVSDRGGFQRIVDLLGGAKVLRHRMNGPLDAHEMILGGIPGAALVHLVDHLVNLPKSDSFERAVGMSLRTIQRRKEAPSKRLSQEQSGRTWKFAEVLAKATAVMGSQEEAEQWLQRPAIGLDQRRPIDLLATPAGLEIVQDFLGRLEYGVYT
ncbi:MAG TPA: antitoxin [Acetobacteraceae bacterium]|jgi:putative toxin-antitoxin system antitoxin component (TIGR02293 family)|nr:antitoxin [Acetobacteraceae bacterium]